MEAFGNSGYVVDEKAVRVENIFLDFLKRLVHFVLISLCRLLLVFLFSQIWAFKKKSLFSKLNFATAIWITMGEKFSTKRRSKR